MVPPGPSAPTRAAGPPTIPSRSGSVWAAQYCFVHEPHDAGPAPVYRLVIRQQPSCARICSFRDKIDRRPVDPPPIVQILAEDARDVELHANSNLFLVAHLVDLRSHHEIRAESGAKCTAGTIIQSPHRLRDLTGEPAVFFAFPDLSIRAEGVHRLEFRLYSTSPKGTVLHTTVVSEPFRVLPPKLFPGMASSTLLTRHIAEQGFKLRVRKKNRSTRMKGRATDEGDSEDEEALSLGADANQSVRRDSYASAVYPSVASHAKSRYGVGPSGSALCGSLTPRCYASQPEFAYPGERPKTNQRSRSPTLLGGSISSHFKKTAAKLNPSRVAQSLSLPPRDARSPHPPHQHSLPSLYTGHRRPPPLPLSSADGGSGGAGPVGMLGLCVLSPSTVTPNTSSAVPSFGNPSNVSSVATSFGPSNAFTASSYFDSRLKRRSHAGMSASSRSTPSSTSVGISTSSSSGTGSTAGAIGCRPSSPPIPPPPLPPPRSSSSPSEASSSQHHCHHHHPYSQDDQSPPIPSQNAMDISTRLPSPASLIAGLDFTPGSSKPLPQRSSEIPDVWDRRAP